MIGKQFFIHPKEIQDFLNGFKLKRKRIRPGKFNPDRLRGIIKQVKSRSKISNLPSAIHKLVWEVMKCQTHIKKLNDKIAKLEARR